jgi:hypothetical protein
MIKTMYIDLHVNVGLFLSGFDKFWIFNRFSKNTQILNLIKIWSDFDHVSSLICGNKVPTRYKRCFLMQLLLLAQHVSGTIMHIIRNSRVLYSWLPPVVFGAWFSSCRYGVELRVVCPVCGLLKQQPIIRSSRILYSWLPPVIFGAWFSSCRYGTHDAKLHTIPTTWKPRTKDHRRQPTV